MVFLRPIARSIITRFTIPKSTRKPRAKDSAHKGNVEERNRAFTYVSLLSNDLSANRLCPCSRLRFRLDVLQVTNINSEHRVAPTPSSPTVFSVSLFERNALCRQRASGVYHRRLFQAMPAHKSGWLTREACVTGSERLEFYSLLAPMRSAAFLPRRPSRSRRLFAIGRPRQQLRSWSLNCHVLAASTGN